jgi:hypothetical protein
MSAALSVRTCVNLNSMPGRSSTVTEIAWCAMGRGFYQAIIDFMRTSALLALLPLVSLVGCALQAPDSDQAFARFRTALDEDWKYWMTQYPELATSLGYPGQNARWTDYSPSAIAARADYLKQSAGRLAAIDRAQLSPEEQLSYDLYRDLLETALAGLEFHNDALPIRGVVPHNLRMPMNQLEGVAAEVPRTLSLMPAATRDDGAGSRAGGRRPATESDARGLFDVAGGDSRRRP